MMNLGKKSGKSGSASGEAFRDDLVNSITKVAAIVVTVTYLAVFIRAFDIGFTFRDALQGFLVAFVVILTLLKDRIGAYRKAFLLVVILSIGALSGFTTLGMLGGTVFLFPAVVVVMAVFYTRRQTMIFIIFTLAVFSLVAAGFCTGLIKLNFDIDLLLPNYFHWLVYGSSFAILMVIAYATIFRYREKMENLLEEVSEQRDELSETNDRLNEAAKNVKILSGLLPICSYCKKIRDDKGYWGQIESYIREHSEAEFTHSICRECEKKYYPDLYDDDEGHSSRD